MGAKAIDHPLVAKWLDKYGRDNTVKQYVSFVRALLRETGKPPADVSPPELVAHALAQTTDWRRKKAISAFGNFFRFVADELKRPDDLSRDLTDRVERAVQARDMADALRCAGLSNEQISGLIWRDVAAGVLVGPQPTVGSALIPQDAKTVRLLGEKLLERLHGADVDTMAGVLSAPVFESD